MKVAVVTAWMTTAAVNAATTSMIGPALPVRISAGNPVDADADQPRAGQPGHGRDQDQRADQQHRPPVRAEQAGQQCPAAAAQQRADSPWTSRRPPRRRSRARPGPERRARSSCAHRPLPPRPGAAPRSSHGSRLRVGAHQELVVRIAGQQLVVGADGADRAVGEHRDPVGQRHRRRPVGDDQRVDAASTSPSAAVTFASVCTSSADSGSSSTSTDGLAEDGPGQREPLPLPAGQRHALLADPGVQAPGQVVDELGLRRAERGPDESSVAPGLPSATFSLTLAENSVGSSNAQATSVRRRRAAGRGCRCPSSRIVPPVASASRATSAAAWSCLSPVRADQGDRLAGGQFQADVAQHGPVAARVGERRRGPGRAGRRSGRAGAAAALRPGLAAGARPGPVVAGPVSAGPVMVGSVSRIS